MTSLHVHLMVAHLPVVGCPIALALMVAGHWLRRDVLLQAAYLLLVACAAFGAVAYYSGPPSYDQLSVTLAADKEWVEQHAVIARSAFIGLVLVAVVAGQACLQFLQQEPPPRWLRWTLLVATSGLCYLLAWTAHLGGEVGHVEIRGGGLNLFPGL